MVRSATPESSIPWRTRLGRWLGRPVGVDLARVPLVIAGSRDRVPDSSREHLGIQLTGDPGAAAAAALYAGPLLVLWGLVNRFRRRRKRRGGR